MTKFLDDAYNSSRKEIEIFFSQGDVTLALRSNMELFTKKLKNIFHYKICRFLLQTCKVT